ncbi:MAG: glycosyltransferase [bacterium]
MEKDKITIALLWPRYGGKVTSVNDLVLGLDKERFDIIFIYLSGHGVDKNFIEEAGYDVFYLSDKKRISSFRFSILSRLVTILKERKVDIIHCHRHKPTVYGAIAAAIAKTPVVMAHVHGLGRSRNSIRKLTNLLLFRRINRLIAVANSVKEDVLRNNWFLSEEKLSVLENSVDYKRFADTQIPQEHAKQLLGMPPRAFVFGTIARFGQYKGHNFLVEAFGKVKNEVPSAHLVLVGDGPLKGELQQQAAKAGIDQSVHFLGQRNDIPELLRAMDAFVLPSIGSEGMPRVILEAMAAKVPCIGTKIGGTPEVIHNKNLGYLVPSKDSEALVQAMISVINLPNEDREALTGKAQAQVQKFYSHDIVRAKLAKLYEDQYSFSKVAAK